MTSPFGHQETLVCQYPGCGKPFPVLRKTERSAGWKPAKFCQDCRYKRQRANLHRDWVKGRRPSGS